MQDAYDHLDPEDIAEIEHTQGLINGLSAWKMEGSYGRMMMALLDSGYCMLGQGDTRDYWGNHIPSRTQVAAGTKGSYEYVANLHGTAWADHVAAIPVPVSIFG